MSTKIKTPDGWKDVAGGSLTPPEGFIQNVDTGMQPVEDGKVMRISKTAFDALAQRDTKVMYYLDEEHDLIDAKPTCRDVDGNLVKNQKIVELTKEQYDAQAKQWAKDNKRKKTIYTSGSGINYGEVYSTAMCWFMEMQWINSGCIHSGEFFHGPFEVTDYDVPFMLVKSIGKTRFLDERVENFAKKFTEDLLVLDQKDLDLSNVAEEARQYVAAILTGVVIRHFVEAIAFERGHSLDVRRYMWQMEY